MGWIRGSSLGAHTYRSIFLATSLVLVGQFLLGRCLPAESSFGVNHPASAVSLACTDVVQIAAWGAKRHGGRVIDLHSKELARRSAEVFIEKLDPNHVLLLESEVQKLENSAVSNWKNLIDQKRCGSFDSWYAQIFSSAQKRLQIWASETQWSALFLERSARKGKSEEQRWDLPSGFAKSAIELTKRQYRYVDYLVKSTSSKVLQSYSANRKRFVMEKLDQNLFGMESDPHSLLAKAVLGAMDPFSTYFSQTEFQDFYQDLSGEAAGVGIRVQKAMGGLLIEDVMMGTPADQAGLKTGDLIVSVEGEKISDLPMQEISRLLRGPESSRVTLGIEREKGCEMVHLVRTSIELDDAKVAFKSMAPKAGQGKVAVLSIPSFYGRGGMGAGPEDRSSSDDLRKALVQLTEASDKTESLVLDLRGNPGGYLEEAVSMAGMFMGEEPVVGVMENSRTRVLKDEEGSKPVYTGPLVVLVDEGTASAGEVLAAALKDHQRAVLVGTHSTYGKGSVQKLFQLDDPFLQVGLQTSSGVMKLTTSLFYSPLGHSPANGGVTTQIALDTDEQASHVSSSHTGMEVAEIPPIVDSPTLERLKQNESAFSDSLTALKLRSQVRLKNGHLEEDAFLSEAVEVAADLTRQEKASAASKIQ